MKRIAVSALLLLCLATMAGCAYFQTKDEPPPLPPIEETKPPLTLKGDHFNAYPWADLPKPAKDGNDPDTFIYVAKDGDTMESIAEKNMGDPSLAPGLASYNGVSSAGTVKSGEKIVIPYPIIGVGSRIMVKAKGEKDFGAPRPFDSEFQAGDEYRLRFEPNVSGYMYVLREGPKEVTMLFPAVSPPPPAPKTKAKGKKTVAPPPPPATAESSKVKAHEPVIIPAVKGGFKYDPKRAGDRVYVFLSLREIPELEDLKGKTKITAAQIQDVLHRVKIGDINSEQPPYTILRISDPKEILGFSLTLKG
jgi:hypothetical protein